MSWLRVAGGIALAVVVIPIALFALFLLWLFGIDHRAKRTPEEVADQLRKFVEGTEGPRDWDDFEVEIQDPRLEAIRAEAMKFSPPPELDQNARDQLAVLLTQAEALRPSSN